MKVITRFAPSPTGYLHTGSARTALFNYLFSKHHNGEFLLRIEDTDIARSTPEATKKIIEDMKWLGLKHDGEIVYQSKNIDRHKQVAHELLEKGNAYRCYSTAQEIEDFRAKNPNEKFRSPWRDIDQSEAPKNGESTIRLKSEQTGSTTIYDLIQGKIEVQNAELDDMVMLRSDGTPTYMLAVVVDDHDMNITHIIRGDDHLTNAFRQKQIYQAMGWEVPEFAHIPLIHDKDGKKLSKRKGALGIFEYQDLGYLPEAVNNHLLRLGWSHGDDEIISIYQAIEWFDFDHVGKSPARFDMDKLNFINSHYIKNYDDSELFELISKFNSKVLMQKERIIKGMSGLKNRATTLKDLADSANIYISKAELDQKSKDILASGATLLLRDFAKELYMLELWTKENLHNLGEEFMNRRNEKPSLLMQALRAGVVGTFASPGIYDVLEALGKDETLTRLSEYK